MLRRKDSRNYKMLHFLRTLYFIMLLCTITLAADHREESLGTNESEMLQCLRECKGFILLLKLDCLFACAIKDYLITRS
ncbi:hypothetical protein RB195_008639 [Necator americanus]|uniref:Uncharacterized protein n=1 Tax=Necator americanus TaxID=51031 RepID=A0ABR1CQE1_NECAM